MCITHTSRSPISCDHFFLFYSISNNCRGVGGDSTGVGGSGSGRSDSGDNGTDSDSVSNGDGSGNSRSAVR